MGAIYVTSDRIRSGKAPVFSASSVLDVVGEALSTIRRDDGLTFADMAAVLGKSEDQAAKYCAGSAEMGMVTYARARREWNGRFDGALDRLCHDTRPVSDSDRQQHSRVAKAAYALAVALESGDLTAADVRANRTTLEQARDSLDALLRRVAVAA